MNPIIAKLKEVYLDPWQPCGIEGCRFCELGIAFRRYAAEIGDEQWPDCVCGDLPGAHANRLDGDGNPALFECLVKGCACRGYAAGGSHE